MIEEITLQSRYECRWACIVCPPEGTMQLPCWQHVFVTTS